MPKYRYTVVNPQNKELTGTIGAPNEKNAREELNQLGFSILNIQEINENEVATTGTKELPKFEFGATDKNGKNVIGSIQAEDRYNAYKRLIKEYLFEIEYLIDSNLDENKKQTERQKGVFELQNQLDEEELTVKKKAAKADFNFEEFNLKQQILKSQVDFVLKKVKEILDRYEKDIKQETKEKIRRSVDKILRIKNSTNLDYIRKNCEELLKFLQQEEIFLYEEVRQKDHSKLALEAKSLMMQLNKKERTQTDFAEKLREWRDQHITNNSQPNTIEHFINFIIGPIIGATAENDTIKNLRNDNRTLNEQLKQYLKLYLQAKNQDFKSEARDGLKKLWQEKKQLKSKIKAAKKAYHEEIKGRNEHSALENLSSEIFNFSGWLLGFYLLYYFISIYLTTKNFGVTTVPEAFFIYRSVFLKYFLAILFLFHCCLGLKMNFFRRSEVASLVITPIFLLATSVILLNF